MFTDDEKCLTETQSQLNSSTDPLGVPFWFWKANAFRLISLQCGVLKCTIKHGCAIGIYSVPAPTASVVLDVLF